MKPKKIKARKIWIPLVWLSQKWGKFTRFCISTYRDEKPTETVFVLPADAASVERMVEQITVSIATRRDSREPHKTSDLSRAALAAIGIKGGKL